MAKFRVEFKGFAFVEAEDEEEAQEKFDDEDYVFCEYGVETIEVVDEFTITV